MKQDKQSTLLLLVGLLLMGVALYLITHVQIPDFTKGLLFGVGSWKNDMACISFNNTVFTRCVSGDIRKSVFSSQIKFG